MGNWNEFEFNEPYEGDVVTEINGVALPQQYIDFMLQHNGGEGDIGETWFVLYPLEELEEINQDYEVSEYLPGKIIIGSNGGGEFYGIDSYGSYFNVPETMEEDCITYFGTDLDMLPDKINEFWKEQ